MFYRTGFRANLFAIDVRFQTSLKRLRFAEMALLGLPVAPDRSVADHLDDIIQAAQVRPLAPADYARISRPKPCRLSDGTPIVRINPQKRTCLRILRNLGNSR